MPAQMLPRYPIYIPSKGRAAQCLTARCLVADGVPFHLVVEPQEAEEYAAQFGAACLLMLPFSNPGSVIPARNWIKAHATEAGAARHWQLDDNIRSFGRRWQSRRIRCPAGASLAVTEEFVERYENIAVAGLNYFMWLPNGKHWPPFYLNCRVYSCSLILNSLPYAWRGRYNEDADYCLQVLSAGWCTVLMNCFFAQKTPSMILRGGNTDALYHGDGRLKMARSLERLWPGVVETKRRFSRPQHVVHKHWRHFDTPLKLKPGVDLAALEPNEYGLVLRQVKPIQSPELAHVVASSLS